MAEYSSIIHSFIFISLPKLTKVAPVISSRADNFAISFSRLITNSNNSSKYAKISSLSDKIDPAGRKSHELNSDFTSNIVKSTSSLNMNTCASIDFKNVVFELFVFPTNNI